MVFPRVPRVPILGSFKPPVPVPRCPSSSSQMTQPRTTDSGTEATSTARRALEKLCKGWKETWTGALVFF